MDIDKICQGIKYPMTLAENKPAVHHMLQFCTVPVDNQFTGSGKASHCEKMLSYPIAIEQPSLLTKITSFLGEYKKNAQD